MRRPLIGITVDNRDNTAASRRYESSIAYSRVITEAGGTPVLLPHEPELASAYVSQCAGLVLTGGVDPRTEAFGEPTHPLARPVDERRQAFELALLDAASRRPELPVLGVCLGMQFMALHAGGRLNQYLPDTHPGCEVHQKDNRHTIALAVADSVLESNETCTVVSYHRQAVAAPGTLRIVATAPDGIIEAIDDPSRPFYLGVQWHPERGGEGGYNAGLIKRFITACARVASSPPPSPSAAALADPLAT